MNSSEPITLPHSRLAQSEGMRGWSATDRALAIYLPLELPRLEFSARAQRALLGKQEVDYVLKLERTMAGITLQPAVFDVEV
jgi:hypothetical protein